MNIFQRLTCKWTERCQGYCRTASLLTTLFLAPVTLAQTAPSPSRPLLPFLEEFKAPATKVLAKGVVIGSAGNMVPGFFARPDVPDAFPAVLLINEGAGLDKWMKQNALDLAGIGYVVLAIDVRKPVAPQAKEATLADLTAAVRWLRRRPEVVSDRIGVVGWSRGGAHALALAATTHLRGCVVCGGANADHAATIARLRGTAVLGIFARKNATDAQQVRLFQQALAKAKVQHRIHIAEQAVDGFMNPSNLRAYDAQAAEIAWVEIYEFLGKYVEDAASTANPTCAKP